MKVLVIGEINSANIGDKAIHAGIKEFLISQNIQISSLDLSCRSQSIRQGIKSSHKHMIKKNKYLYLLLNVARRTFRHLKNLKCWMKEFKSADVVLVGGGSLLINNSYSFPLSLMFVKMCSFLVKKDYYVIGCSASKDVDTVSKRMLGYFLKSAKQIYLRDKLSVQYVEQNYGLKSICSTDLALLLDVNRKSEPSDKLVAINIIGFSQHNVLHHKSFQKGYKQRIVEVICLLKKEGYEVKLFTTGEQNDYANAVDIIKEYGSDIDVYHPASVNDLLGWLYTCSGVISTRLHSAILAYVSGVNFVSISWDKKIDGFLDSIGQAENCFSINDSAEAIVERLCETLMEDQEFEKGRLVALIKKHVKDILNEKDSHTY